ncbi:hypothetical protein ABZZ79_08585 [Streptomyces sp. NPDC006458]|uniref:hypothetical protein n=1 Tax=Streptomyces sp. NPDC006458 TaxID=3154302 RepID=UPI0033BC9B8A
MPRLVATDVPGAVAVPPVAPRVVHRTELLLAGTPRGAAAHAVDALAGSLRPVTGKASRR